MASELSNYLANAILNWTRGVAMPAAPANVYLALYNGDPLADGTGGDEVTTDIRPAGRLPIPWSAVAAREITSTADIDFGASAGAATVTHCAVFDAQAGGNLLMRSAVDTPRNVIAEAPVIVVAGSQKFNFN